MSNLEESSPDKNFALANRVIDIEKKKIELENNSNKIALENQDKSDERNFKIAQERNEIDKNVFSMDDRHRKRVFWASCFFILLFICFIFFITYRESKFGITILTHSLTFSISAIAFYFYGKSKRR